MSSKIRVGLLSYGMSGKVFHAPLLHVNSGFEMKKIMQRQANDSQERYPYVQVVRTAGEIISDPDIDLVLVNTPDHTHYEYARAALSAGKHVVVEKPFVLDVAEGEDLIELAAKKRLILTVFQSRRWDGDFLTVQKIINSGNLGRLVEYITHFDRFRNFIRESWKEKPEFKSGTLYNLGSHLIDQALCLFGMPDAVYADIRKMRSGAQTDDYFDLNLYYPEIKVSLKSSYLVREPGARFMVHGTEGSFVKYGSDPQEEALNQGLYPEGPEWGRDEEKNWGILNTNINGIHVRRQIETLAGCYPEFYNRLSESIIAGVIPAVKPEESLQGIRVIRAAYESSERRCPVLTK